MIVCIIVVVLVYMIHINFFTFAKQIEVEKLLGASYSLIKRPFLMLVPGILGSAFVAHRRQPFGAWTRLRARFRYSARTQRLDDLAVGNRPVSAGTNHAIQFSAQRGEIADLAVDVVEVDAGDAVHRFAGLRLVVGQSQQFPHSFQREAEITGAADEREACQMLGPIGEVIGGGQGRARPDRISVAGSDRISEGRFHALEVFESCFHDVQVRLRNCLRVSASIHAIFQP